MKSNRSLMVLVGLMALIGLGVFAQDGMLYVLPNPPTVMVAVSNNVSTLVFAAVNSTATLHRVHYSLISNRGATDVVFDFSTSMHTTNLNAGSLTNSVWVGHLLHPDDAYELPADKEYDGPFSAVSTNGTGSGILAITVAYNQN